MLVNVETRPDASGDREPASFSYGSHILHVREVLDRWPAREYAYFKVEADDGARYILRHTTASGEWDMHSFNASGSP